MHFGRILRFVGFLFGSLLFPFIVYADFTGPVVSVLDGDTIEVLHKQHSERIRLSAIDCPEKGQWFRELGQEEGKL